MHSLRWKMFLVVIFFFFFAFVISLMPCVAYFLPCGSHLKHLNSDFGLRTRGLLKKNKKKTHFFLSFSISPYGIELIWFGHWNLVSSLIKICNSLNEKKFEWANREKCAHAIDYVDSGIDYVSGLSCGRTKYKTQSNTAQSKMCNEIEAKLTQK